MGSISFSLDNMEVAVDESSEEEEEERGDGALLPQGNRPMKVSLKVLDGYICQGYSGEPVFTGRFNMTRIPTGLPNINIE